MRHQKRVATAECARRRRRPGGPGGVAGRRGARASRGCSAPSGSEAALAEAQRLWLLQVGPSLRGATRRRRARRPAARGGGTAGRPHPDYAGLRAASASEADVISSSRSLHVPTSLALPTTRLLRILCSEAVMAMRAVPSNEPLTKRRPSGSSARRTRSTCGLEGAQHGAIGAGEEPAGLVDPTGERVLVVGQRHGAHVVGVQLEVFSRVPLRSHTRTVLSCEPLRMRWPSGIAATAVECARQVLTGSWWRRSGPGVVIRAADVLAVGRHRRSPSWCALEGVRACSRRGTADLANAVQPDLAVSRGRRQSRRAAPRRSSRWLSGWPQKRCARERRRASTASRWGRTSR